MSKIRISNCQRRLRRDSTKLPHPPYPQAGERTIIHRFGYYVWNPVKHCQAKKKQAICNYLYCIVANEPPRGVLGKDVAQSMLVQSLSQVNEKSKVWETWENTLSRVLYSEKNLAAKCHHQTDCTPHCYNIADLDPF